MQHSDIRAVGDLAGDASSVLTTLVRGMHAGISGRVFDSIGPSAKPIRTIHDGLTQWNHGNVLTEQESPLAGAMTWSDRKALLALASHDLFRSSRSLD